MAAHPYGLRTRFHAHNGSATLSTPTKSPFPRSGSRSPRKYNTGTTLNLRSVIGTTTSNPSGLTAYDGSRTFAYCAGSAAVLANVEDDGQVTQRFFRARPLASSINPQTPYYSQSTPTATPTKRKSIMPGLNTYLTPTSSPIRARREEESGHTWTERERIKAATSVSLSRDGRLLAVGETGYNPRVMIFSTSENNPIDIPLSIMSEHSFGVRAVAFSPDSQFLATLGDINDGFLFIWSVNPKSGATRLHSTNKCKVDVRDMVWLGNNLITVGTRHVKIWQVSDAQKGSPARRARLRTDLEATHSPAPMPLPGRNILLGSLIDSTFTCVTPISNHEAIACTEDGRVCLLEDGGGISGLKVLKRTRAGIFAVACEESLGRIHFGDAMGGVSTENIDKLRQMARSPRRVSSEVTGKSPRSPSSPDVPEGENARRPQGRSICALRCLPGIVISMAKDSTIKLIDVSCKPQQPPNRLSSHDHPAQGLQVLPSSTTRGAFYTWTAKGEIKFWDTKGLPLESRKVFTEVATEPDDCSNDMAAVHYCLELDCLIFGDQIGVITTVDAGDWTTRQRTRAHGAQVCCIASQTVKGVTLVASCSRDRMVQLFRSQQGSLELIQTMDDHIGAVSQILFTGDGERFLSSSADRTIIVRDRISRQDSGVEISAYLTARIVTLKATPISMSLIPGNPDLLAVSTMDRCVTKLNILDGDIGDSFKAADPDNDDTVALQSICLTSRSNDIPQLLLGYSSNDKSVRVYDFEKNVLVTRESGHTEGISDLALLEHPSTEDNSIESTIISTGLDGTIMIWNLVAQPPQPLGTPLEELGPGQVLSPGADMTPTKASPASLPPLRKILSKLDMADFSRIDPASGSTVPIRDPSPARLRRKTSRLTMVENQIPEDGVALLPRKAVNGIHARRGIGPAPSPTVPSRRSRTDPDEGQPICRSPSPPLYSASTPNTPHRNRPNNGRLRRPPSVPADLRGQALQHSRRQSVGSSHDFGSTGMAGDQACRMLRMYRKRLAGAQVELDLHEVEDELRATLDLVRLRRKGGNARQAVGVAESAESDVENLAVLLARTGVVDEEEAAAAAEAVSA